MVRKRCPHWQFGEAEDRERPFLRRRLWMPVSFNWIWTAVAGVAVYCALGWLFRRLGIRPHVAGWAGIRRTVLGVLGGLLGGLVIWGFQCWRHGWSKPSPEMVSFFTAMMLGSVVDDLIGTRSAGRT